MTRLQRQEAFADELEDLVSKWLLRLNVTEIVGILTVQGVRLTVDTVYEIEEDDGGEEWKR